MQFALNQSTVISTNTISYPVYNLPPHQEGELKITNT